MSKKSISVAKRCSDLLTAEEIRQFPFVFAISFHYRKIDRMAGYFEALGIPTKILTTGAGYALVLHHPDEAG